MLKVATKVFGGQQSKWGNGKENETEMTDGKAEEKIWKSCEDLKTEHCFK